MQKFTFFQNLQIQLLVFSNTSSQLTLIVRISLRNMINHPQKGIFNALRTQPLTGRNANIQTAMFKRKQIFEKSPNQRIEPPFSGYSFTGSTVTDNSSLARSQVSQFSQQNVIRLIKQQLEKNNINSASETSEESLKNKNELNILRIQIRSIKQSYHELNKSFKKKIQDQNETINEIKKQMMSQLKDNSFSKDEISAQLMQKIKEIEQDIAIKMKLIFVKIQEDLRKQFTTYANREFVPTSFLDDLDKQLNDLDDRIANIENEYEASKTKGGKQSLTFSKFDKDSSMILNSGSELKLKQLERDLMNLKKELDDKSDKIKEMEESMLSANESLSRQLKQMKQSVVEITSGMKEHLKESQTSHSNIQSKMQADKQKLFQKLQSQFESLSKRLDQELALKSLTLSNSIAQIEKNIAKNSNTSIVLEKNETAKVEETNEESNVSEFSVTNNDGKQSLDQNPFAKKVQNQENNSFPVIPSANEAITLKDSPKKTKKITITYGGAEKPSNQTYQNTTAIEQKANQISLNSNSLIQINQQYKNSYKVDKEGFLMDWNNKYILSPSNAMIYVSEKQIEVMEKSNLIKIERWGENINLQK